MPRRKPRLLRLHETLFRALGPQHWWPGEGALEISAGAILTQNTSWGNVEKAIQNLRRAGALKNPAALAAVPLPQLEALIRPSGYFRQKARRLRLFARYVMKNHGGSLRRFYGKPLPELRAELLALHGIGPETADCICLYAADKTTLAVDAYTRRILARHGFPVAPLGYGALKAFCEKNLPRSARVYNEFHALLVQTGKNWCRRRHPRCGECPLRAFHPVRPEVMA